MRITQSRKKQFKEFDFPTPMYYLAKFFHSYPILAKILDSIETQSLRKSLQEIRVDRPVFITGLARAGSTITLEMLSKHPEIATHRYFHMVLPFAPYWIAQVASRVPLMTSPVERLHRDRIIVTKDSPEAVEEIIWQFFFKDTQDESISNIIIPKSQFPEFETFYRLHIKKLLISQNVPRYLAKNNYNVARMEYLLNIFPDVRFVILVRNPFDHIASLAKQDIVIRELEQNNYLLLDWTKIIGHLEFGSARVCINLDNFDTIQKIRHLWKQKNTYIKAWALYWTSMYSYIHHSLESNPNLSQCCIVVRYEDLCEFPEKTIDRIIDHIQVNPKQFEAIKRSYSKRLSKPTYYQTRFTSTEREDIISETTQTAKLFGYTL